jgi:hypothetical protein
VADGASRKDPSAGAAGACQRVLATLGASSPLSGPGVCPAKSSPDVGRAFRSTLGALRRLVLTLEGALVGEDPSATRGGRRAGIPWPLLIGPEQGHRLLSLRWVATARYGVRNEPPPVPSCAQLLSNVFARVVRHRASPRGGSRYCGAEDFGADSACPRPPFVRVRVGGDGGGVAG